MALGYVRRGWALLPLLPGRKEPYSDLLPKDRTGAPSWRLLSIQPATEAEVGEWFRRDPAVNIGVIPEAAGLVIVDVDHAPTTPLHIPPTATVTTARGGHYYYRSERPVPTVKCSWGEIRATGAYVVAAGSLHPSGVTYAWADFCSPDDLDIADFPEDLLRAAEEDRDRLKQSRGQVSKKTYSFTYLPRPETSGHVLDDWFRSEEAAVRILQACGVGNPRVGKGVPCCLPGHREKHPSAALWRQPDGVFGYHDFHQKDGRQWYSLAEVYASVQAGKTLKLGPGETATWMLRAVMEVGLVKAPTVMAPKLPDGAPEIVRDVYAGFLKLLAVRAVYDPTQTSAPYSWRFAATWCGRSERHTGEAIRWLLERGYLRVVDDQGVKGTRKASLLALGTPRGQAHA